MARRKPKKSRGKSLNSSTGRQAAMKRWDARRAADTRTAPTYDIAAPGQPGGAGGEFQAEDGRLRAAGASDRDAVGGATEVHAQRRAQEVEGQAPAA